MNCLYLGVLVAISITLGVADYAQYVDFIKKQAQNKTFVEEFEKHAKLFRDDSYKSKRLGDRFHCDVMNKPPRSSMTVHNLTPMDVNVIAAMGDSITAGTGIKAITVVGLLIENRGISWSIGGDGSTENHETLANIIKKYDPDLKGFSTGEGPVWFPNAHLNVANPGDKSEDMPGQADLLISRLKSDKSINYEEDWKVVTLFIGGNDLCDYCDDTEKYSAENYINNIRIALDKLHAEVPKVFINLVQVLNIANVNELNQNFLCSTFHLFFCRCGAYPWNDEERQLMLDGVKKYNEGLNELVLSGRYDTRDDFTVVIQPFFRDTPIPKKPGTDEADLSYFSPDCFHLSQKGHEAAADALWNNMIEPVGEKRTMWTPDEVVDCPTTDSPYFATYKNSKSKKQVGLARNPSQDSAPETQSSSASTVGAVIGVCVLILMVVVSVVAWRRRNVKKEEERLIKSEMPLSYTEI